MHIVMSVDHEASLPLPLGTRHHNGLATLIHQFRVQAQIGQVLLHPLGTGQGIGIMALLSTHRRETKQVFEFLYKTISVFINIRINGICHGKIPFAKK